MKEKFTGFHTIINTIKDIIVQRVVRMELPENVNYLGMKRMKLLKLNT